MKRIPAHSGDVARNAKTERVRPVKTARVPAKTERGAVTTERTAHKNAVTASTRVTVPSTTSSTEAANAPLASTVLSGIDAVARLKGPKATSLLELRALAKDEPLDVIFKKHLADFRVAFAAMRLQPPSVVFFGGARLKPGDKYYALAEKFGAALARHGIPPKTGRGPGAMHAVPEGFILERDALSEKVLQSVVDGVSRLAHIWDLRTLGFNIKLPKEQGASPSIENGGQLEEFPIRKMSLWENVRGAVVLPGGFGTMDELMEVLILRQQGKTRDPIVLAGKEFWEPILAVLREATQRNGADLLGNLLDGVLVTDDPEEALAHIEGAPGVKSFDEDPDDLYKSMVKEIKVASYVARHQERAVTILGGNALAKGDSALDIVAGFAQSVDQRLLRVGEEGQVSALLSSDAQRVFWGEDAPKRGARIDVNNVTFKERVPHKEALLRNSSAYVVLPDAGRGKDELCTVLCQIQTGKMARKPIVLVDEAYWKPILASWHAQMIGPDHAYIAEDDMKLVTYANSVDDVVNALNSVK